MTRPTPEFSGGSGPRRTDEDDSLLRVDLEVFEALTLVRTDADDASSPRIDRWLGTWATTEE